MGNARPVSPPRRRGAALRLAAALSAVVLAAGCASASGGSQKLGAFVPPPVPVAEPHDRAEDTLNLVVWAGYAEDAWVIPFQKATGCSVHATLAGSSDQMVSLVKSGQFDAVSA